MQPGKKNLQLIQVLRAVASLLVVFFHVTHNTTEILNKKFLYNFFEFGGAGVDIFFVLSGFIITYTSLAAAKNNRNIFSFWRRRFVRIYPTYWIIISGFLLLQILLPTYYRTHFSFDLKNIFSTYLLFPGHVMVNGVSWTLSYELLFYFLFSFAFIIRDKKLCFKLFVIYSLTIILLPVFGYSYQDENAWVNIFTFPMNIEFFMGVTAALIIPELSIPISRALIFTGTVIFLISGIFYDLGYTILSNNFNRVVLFGFPSFLIVSGVVKYEMTHKIKMRNIFLLLGEASYSLYLIHLPIVVAFINILSKFNIKNSLLIHTLLFIVIGIICYISIVFYKFVEKPIITRLNSLRRIKVANEI